MAVMKKYDNRIKLAIIISILFFIGCAVVSIGGLFMARLIVGDVNKNVYYLEGTTPVLVQRTMMDEALDVEVKSHVEMFHHFFFTLTPDEQYINYTMAKAMSLVDETGLAQYNALKEKGFYNNIIGTSSVFSIFCDSIKFDKGTMEWTYYGRQRIERRTSILIRQIVTSGKIKRVPRTEGNSYGLMIADWRTLLNKDIEQRQKSNIN